MEVKWNNMIKILNHSKMKQMKWDNMKWNNMEEYGNEYIYLNDNKEKSTEEILDGIPIEEIEKYLRKKKLEQLKQLKNGQVKTINRTNFRK